MYDYLAGNILPRLDRLEQENQCRNFAVISARRI